ncbi:MAG TPA: hypothetical protein ENK61_00165 [Devosia sp.]|nr:hypothetical protein [Devosia sp.]
MELFLAIAHVTAASLVSIHVLLTHHEVRSSIGWIGLSWLSPFIGSSIYIAFGVNRVVRRARKSGFEPRLGAMQAQCVPPVAVSDDFPENIAAIAKAGDSISGLPLLEGNSMELFSDGDEAYPQMLKAIEEAQHSIALASYIFASDSTGHLFADKLIAASRRGVDVRVLLDGIGSGYFYVPIIKRLREGGVRTEQFLHKWAPWAMTFINLRNHKKLLVVDGKTGFTGGMNIADENISDENLVLKGKSARANGGNKERGRPAVRDVQARIRGPVVGHLLQAFARDWEFTTGESLMGDIWWPQISCEGDIAMRGIVSGPDDSVGQIEALFATAVEQASHRVRIVTPYFLPEDRLFEVIRRAAMRGVIVEILVPEKSNHFYFDWAMSAHMATFSLDGIGCYEVAGPFDHSKLLSVDGQWCSVGSANWDARSMRLNFEFQVECYGKEICSRVDKLIDQKLKTGRLLQRQNIDARPIPIKLRDAAARLFLPYL